MVSDYNLASHGGLLAGSCALIIWIFSTSCQPQLPKSNYQASAAGSTSLLSRRRELASLQEHLWQYRQSERLYHQTEEILHEEGCLCPLISSWLTHSISLYGMRTKHGKLKSKICEFWCCNSSQHPLSAFSKWGAQTCWGFDGGKHERFTNFNPMT